MDYVILYKRTRARMSSTRGLLTILGVLIFLVALSFYLIKLDQRRDKYNIFSVTEEIFYK